MPDRSVDEAFFSQWSDLAIKEPRLRVRGPRCSLELCLEVGATPWHLTLDRGAIVAVAKGPFHMKRSDLLIRAPEPIWQQFWSPVPAPGMHDIFAMSSFGHAHIDGDLHLLRAHLGFLKELLALPRRFHPAARQTA